MDLRQLPNVTPLTHLEEHEVGQGHFFVERVRGGLEQRRNPKELVQAAHRLKRPKHAEK